MNAIVVDEHGEPDVLQPQDQPEPNPAPDEVKIAVEACGVNFVDVERRRGTYPDKPDIKTPVPPYIPGSEPAGRVVAAGEDTEFEVGDDVMSFMGYSSYSEYTTVPGDRLMPIPEGLDYEEAAGIPVQFLTAHNALFERGNLEAGETVLVHAGAGGVGTAAIQLANRVDCTIYTTASSDRKLEFTRNLGADRAIDYTEESIMSIADEELEDGFDLVLDGVGGRPFKESVRSLAPGGRLITYGLASGKIPSIAAPRLLFSNRTITGYHLEHLYANLRGDLMSAKDEVIELFRRGELDVFVDRTFPLEDAADAHRYIESRESIGKIVIVTES